MDYEIQILNNADQLGASNSRNVTISGTLQYTEFYGNYEAWQNKVADVFRQNGWNILGVTLKSPGIILARESITIRANVFSNFSTYQISETARQLLANITNERLNNTYPIFEDIRLETVEGNYVPSGGAGGAGTPPGEKNFLEKLADDLSLTNLFGAAGTTTLAVSAVLIGIIIFKR
jgi:hypothetical protein